MPSERRRFTAAEKVAILREHLLDKVPISELCQKHTLQPTLFYTWQKKLFEGAAAVFDGSLGRPGRTPDARRIEALEGKLREKNDVLVELLNEYVNLKKAQGRL